MLHMLHVLILPCLIGCYDYQADGNGTLSASEVAQLYRSARGERLSAKPLAEAMAKVGKL